MRRRRRVVGYPWQGLGIWIRGRYPLDRRHFGQIVTNFEHHGIEYPPIGINGGIEHDVAGHLCSGTCGIGRNLRDSCAHAAEPKPQPVGSLAHAINAHGTQLVARAEPWLRTTQAIEKGQWNNSYSPQPKNVVHATVATAQTPRIDTRMILLAIDSILNFEKNPTQAG